MKKLHVLLLCLIVALATAAITLTVVFVAYRPSKPAKEETSELTYGSAFTYKNLKITIGSDVEFDKYQDICIPFTVENLNGKFFDLAELEYKVYTPDQYQTRDCWLYDPEEKSDLHKIPRLGEIVDCILKIGSDGDGDYYIVFGNDMVILPITKQTD